MAISSCQAESGREGRERGEGGVEGKKGKKEEIEGRDRERIRKEEAYTQTKLGIGGVVIGTRHSIYNNMRVYIHVHYVYLHMEERVHLSTNMWLPWNLSSSTFHAYWKACNQYHNHAPNYPATGKEVTVATLLARPHHTLHISSFRAFTAQWRAL